MLVYHASEKDCVGEDGEGGQECVICFEEFAVGDEMGRLECLCKFHKVRSSTLPELYKKIKLTVLGVHTAMVGYKGFWGLSGASRRHLSLRRFSLCHGSDVWVCKASCLCDGQYDGFEYGSQSGIWVHWGNLKLVNSEIGLGRQLDITPTQIMFTWSHG